MYDRRAKNVAVFEDSMGLMNENKMLRQAIRTSIEKQKLYLEDLLREVNRITGGKAAR